MRKLLFLFIALLCVCHVSAQKRSQVQLTSSTEIKGVERNGVQFFRVINPVFVQEGSTLRADSSDYNQAGNAFDAFGHVVITQPDGTVIYSDLLNYDGNTRTAILTNNVRMVDKTSILTTNHLTYKMANRIGTYIGGGKIENGKDILTSKNGYYFASTNDAYFRFDVVVNTPDALINTDTLKYNTNSKVAYFYGPTTINGKNANKASRLYTENGRYNTMTDQAWFGKENLYTEGSKSLKGDSLFYDGKAGMGKAVNNITFLDTVQKVILKGNQGIYRRADESALVTRNAYVVMEVEKDSASVDSIYMTADTLMTKMIYKKDLIPANPEELKSDEEIEEDPEGAIVEDGGIAIPKRLAPPPAPPKQEPEVKVSKRDRKRKKEQDQASKAERPLEDTQPAGVSMAVTDSTNVLDTTETRLATDSITPATDSLSKKVAGSRGSLTQGASADTTGKKATFNPQDTVKTRIINAYHKVKIFKSDLQSRSDSTFYSYADSIIRCYNNPIIWTQGTQLTADTIFLQMKNQKLDNMLLQNNGLIVSAEGDSSRFNQVKGKVLTGLFKDSKLESMFVDGNAESIYYTLEDSVYTGFNRSLSSRMKLEFADSKLKRVVLVRKPEGKYYPIEKAPKDMEILEGFIWKPKDRPKSKEEIIPALQPQKSPAASGKTPSKPQQPSKAVTRR